MDIVSFQDYARTHFGRALPGEFLEDAVDWPGVFLHKIWSEETNDPRSLRQI